MEQILITYDLRIPGRDYETLIKALTRMGAQRILKSAWVLRSDEAPMTIATRLEKLMDANDGLLVCPIGPGAQTNLEVDIRTV